ncbi:MAG: Gfo/Idh/MocA family oxidoreductase [Planctomycetes bacterium]|nr:Gfo/Idh/MocA family oxidoreductase [Planctomycetota bacterium]MBL7146217.1 Gfo/Idh/MocA family oxidoreductase [Phycisphaerae bacterium]
MSDITNKTTSRRDFLKDTGRIAAASTFMAAAAPRMYAGQSNTIKVALIGCGGRGTGAADNALSVKQGPIQLVAMGDVFENRLNSSYENLNKMHADKMNVPRSRRFIGFDAYKKAMDCLSPGDVAIFATPPAFRWVHFTYAIKKGLNVFMEKPVTVDGPTSRRMFELGKQATEKNLKVGVGLMSRHSRALQELAKRIHDGEIGDIILQRAYRMHGPIGFFSSLPKPPGISDLMYQIQRFHSFIWASGGNFSDFNIHLIDHQCWMKNDWPVKAQALGGRHYRQSPDGVTYVDQNFDTYSVEYTYEDGATFLLNGRCILGCKDIYASYAHGSKGMAVVSKSGDCGMPSSIHEGQKPLRSNLVWESRVRPDERSPYQNEWNDLVDAIRNDVPYNETERGVKASLVTSLGRMAAHTGQEVTYEEILNSDHEMAPGLDTLTENSRAPLVADAEGRYPVPQPGIIKQREY